MVLTPENIDSLKKFIADELGKTFELQGHKMTGALIQRLQWVNSESNDRILMQLLMDMYGVYLDTGTPAMKIPYSLPSGRGGKSKYIQGLISYVEKRMGLPEKKAKSVAFAIAATHLKDGMPTIKSARFSQNGRRTMFLTRTLLEKEDIITSRMRSTFHKIYIGRMENKIFDLVSKFNSQ